MKNWILPLGELEVLVKMDKDYKQPKTRQEKKGGKEKQVYTQKHVRAQEALAEKRKSANAKPG